MTFASDPDTDARAVEQLGRVSVRSLVNQFAGSPRSKLKYFIIGVNEELIQQGLTELRVESISLRRAKQMPLLKKLGFLWRRFQYKRGWRTSI